MTREPCDEHHYTKTERSTGLDPALQRGRDRGPDPQGVVSAGRPWWGIERCGRATGRAAPAACIAPARGCRRETTAVEDAAAPLVDGSDPRKTGTGIILTPKWVENDSILICARPG